MNRKILYLIIALCLLSIGVAAKIIEIYPADARMTTIIAGGGGGGAPGGCSMGSSTFIFDSAHASGFDFACDSTGAGLDGVPSGTPTIDGNGVTYNAVDEGLSWTIDSSEIDTGGSSTGTIICTVNRDDTSNSLFEASNIAGQGTAKFVVYNQNAYVYGRWYGNTSNQIVEVGGFTANTDMRVGYSWTQGGTHTLSVTAVGAAASWVADEDTLEAMSAQVDDFTIGEKNNVGDIAGTVTVSDCYMSAGYKDADPLETP